MRSLKTAKYYFLLMAIVIAVNNYAQSQNGSTTVIGTIVDSLNDPIDYATVTVYMQDDTVSVIAGTLSNDKGRFEIRNLPLGVYYFKVSHIFYSRKVIVINASVNYLLLDTIVLTSRSYAIEDITVSPSYVERRPNSYKVSMRSNPIAEGKTINETRGYLRNMASLLTV